MEDERRPRPRAVAQAEELAILAGDRGRDDLVARLRELTDRLRDPATTVVVVGEFKQGKSSLVNALLGTDVCAVDDAMATAVPTFVRHASAPTVSAMFGQRLEHRAPGEVAALTREHEGGAPSPRPTSVVVGVPSDVLADGLVLVDTPGLGGLDSRTGALTLGAVARADAVLFVTDASQELTATELDALRSAHARCPAVTLVLTKVDINPAWRKVLALDAEHLAEAGFDDVAIFPVASARREVGDAAGLRELSSHLRDDVVGRAEELAAAHAGAELREVAGHLEATLQAERRALDDGGAEVAALEEAVARSERLQQAGSRWRVALDDGFTDAAADLDHEVRTAFRRLLTDAEAAIDKADPAQTWGELEPWLNRRMMSDVVACFSSLEARLTGLAADIDALFRVEGDEAVASLGIDLSSPVGVRTLDGQLRVGTPSLLGKEAFTALRGLQGGVMLFGVVAQLAGLALTGPAVVAFGVVMGGRSLREERRKQLAQRKQRAKVPVRKWLDEVQVVVAKEAAGRLREAQRTLRDRFEEQARSLQRSSEDALHAARRSAAIAEADRDRRRRDLDRRLEAIRAAVAP